MALPFNAIKGNQIIPSSNGERLVLEHFLKRAAYQRKMVLMPASIGLFSVSFDVQHNVVRCEMETKRLMSVSFDLLMVSLDV